MSTKSSPRASSGSLTSPSPSPPPEPTSKMPPSTTKAPATALDSSSELSELTEDEQDGSRASTHSNTPNQDNRRAPRRKRSGIVPEPMWDWAYRPNGRKSNDTDEPASAGSKNSNPSVSHAFDGVSGKDNDDEVGDGPRPYTARRLTSDNERVNDGGSHSDDSGDNDDAVDSEPEPEDDDPASKPLSTTVPIDKDDTRESSAALTEDDPADPVTATPRSDYSMESEEEEPHEEEDEVTGDAADDAEEDEEEDETGKNVDTVSVVPPVPSGSSIMAGQQLIRTPSASPSTSPEPEEEPAEEPASALSEKGVKAEPVEPEAVTAPSNNEDEAEIADQPEVEAGRDPEVEPEVEAEEAELELQPAHRAEALDVLAQIELRFALVREALYVEKMEDLAMEEALILQGLHPEMLHLQNELQARHDRRLELAVKKRKYEDDHVTFMRKVEEDAIWSWWKYERDELQTEMFAESSRKRRKLEREKRALERPPISRPIPQRSTSMVPTKRLTARELVKYASLDSTQDRSKLKRRRGEPVDEKYTYPSLPILSAQEIQNDLQLLTAPRPRPYHGPVMGEIGPGMGMASPFEQHYMDYNAPPGMGPPGHGPPFVPAPIGVHHPYGPPPPGRIYHPQPPGPPAPPPMGSIHHSGPRAMQGPGAPLMAGYHPQNTRQMRRSPSPPRMQGYEHGSAINGGPPYGASSGPGQHWAQVPPGTNSNGIAGPSKQSTVNGYGKEPRRDGRERDARLERERDRERLWHENNAKEAQAQDEYGRLHTPHLHRNSHVHQQLQGVPHHHHVVHRHNAHHHHPPGRTPSQHSLQRTHEIDRDSPSRHPLPPVEHINLLSKPAPSSPYRKQEEDDRERERDRDRERSRTVPGPPPMSQLGPPPEKDRPQATPFVMTPSQAMQAGFNPPRTDGRDSSRREPWMDDRARYEQPDGYNHPPHSEGSSRRSHAGHSRQGSSTTLGSPRMRNGTAISPQTPPPSMPLPPSGPGMGPAPPPVFTPGLLHSPSRLSSSLHASPLASAGISTPKGVITRPLSPLPVPSKALPSAFTPAGPGTPGGSGSRLGTPGLAGPGTRPDGPGPLNGHGLGLTHGPGLYPPPGSGLAGPAQPLIPPGSSEPSHIVPPKMMPVHTANGS